MSTTDAIYGVTKTLIQLLTGPLQDVNNSASATALLPDKVTDGLQEGQSRVNLFLYQTMINSGWSNLNPPAHHKAGELKPPLALNLYYLLTVYADDNPQLSQHLLGKAMSVLHTNAELTRNKLKETTPESELDKQIDKVFITPQPLTIDEMSKLWSTFQTQYRTSVAYQVSVVLIDSESPQTPLPVLRRGPKDQGVISQPDLTPPVPTLTEIELPPRQPSLLLTDTLTIKGHKLKLQTPDDTPTQIIFRHSLFDDPLKIEAGPGSTAETIKISLNDLPPTEENFPAGFYQIAAEVAEARAKEMDETEEEIAETPEVEIIPRITNTLAFPLAPQIDVGGAENLDGGLDTPQADTLTLSLTFRPKVWPDQQVSLLLGSREFRADNRPSELTDTLTFTISTPDQKLPGGIYRVRLRVDGVDSHLIKDFTALPLKFDDTLRVTIPDG